MTMISGIFRHCDLNSCTDSIENCLSSAYDGLASLIEKVAVVFGRVLVWIVETAYLILGKMTQPISWMLQKTISLICCGYGSYRGVTLNSSAFHLAPPPLDLHTLTDEADNIDVDDLVTEYQRLFGQESNFIEQNGLRILTSMVRLNVHERSGSYDEMYNATLKKALQNIILELRRQAVPLEKKKRALKALAEGGRNGCGPRKLEECLRQCRLLKSTASEMSTLLLGYIQDLKEEMFLTAFQGHQFHVINYIRTQVGEEYGLNRSPLNLRDPHGTMGAPCCDPFNIQLHYVFRSQYTVERLVHGIMNRLHLDENNLVWLDYMQEQLRRDAVARGENPTDAAVQDRMVEDVMSFFDGSLINEKGVIYLLKSQGIVVPA